MSEIISYNGDSVQVDGQVTKVTTFASKGGGLTVSVDMTDEPAVAAALIKNRGNLARVTFEFSSAKAKGVEYSAQEEQAQGQLALDDLDSAIEGDE